MGQLAQMGQRASRVNRVSNKANSQQAQQGRASRRRPGHRPAQLNRRSDAGASHSEHAPAAARPGRQRAEAAAPPPDSQDARRALQSTAYRPIGNQVVEPGHQADRAGANQQEVRTGFAQAIASQEQGSIDPATPPKN